MKLKLEMHPDERKALRRKENRLSELERKLEEVLSKLKENDDEEDN